MDYFRTITIILEIILVIIFIIFIIHQIKKPTLIKMLIGLTDTTPEYELRARDDKSKVEEFDKYTIWSTPNNKKCVIFVVGGSFMFSNRKTSYGLLNNLSDLLPDYDIISISYPVLFDGVIHDSMKGINDVLKPFVGKYEEYHGVAFSAGCMLLNAFMNKEEDENTAKIMQLDQIGLKIKSATLICGIHYTSLWSGFMDTLFSHYVLGKTPHPECYNAMSVTHNQPYFIISSTKNFLHAQSLKFLAKNKAKSLIYNKDYLTHGFIQVTNLEETQEAIKEIASFIVNN